MDLDRARQFARTHHHAVAATRRQGGRLQQSPVLVGVDAEGRFVISSRETAFKTRHVRRDPWIQLCIFPDDFFGDWVWVEGRASVLSMPEAMEPLVDYFRRVAGEHDDWDAYRNSMLNEQRVLIRIEAASAGPDHQG